MTRLDRSERLEQPGTIPAGHQTGAYDGLQALQRPQ
jgi:hypothetical protein